MHHETSGNCYRYPPCSSPFSRSCRAVANQKQAHYPTAMVHGTAPLHRNSSAASRLGSGFFAARTAAPRGPTQSFITIKTYGSEVGKTISQKSCSVARVRIVCVCAVGRAELRATLSAEPGPSLLLWLLLFFVALGVPIGAPMASRGWCPDWCPDRCAVARRVARGCPSQRTVAEASIPTTPR
jgi:hypothetical protein